MTLSLDNALGLQQHALGVLARRMEVVSSNLANVDTPGYQARDVDFRKALASASSERTLVRTHAGHRSIGGAADASDASILDRPVEQPSADGNSVDPHRERTAFAEATVRYESTLTFLGSRIAGLKAALRVE